MFVKQALMKLSLVLLMAPACAAGALPPDECISGDECIAESTPTKALLQSRISLERPSKTLELSQASAPLAGTKKATSQFRPMYVWEVMGEHTFEDCEQICMKAGKGLHMPCITSFDSNNQMRAFMHQRGVNSAWIGHRARANKRGEWWVDDECEQLQVRQYKGDLVRRPVFEDFADTEGCAVVSAHDSGTEHHWTKDPTCKGPEQCLCQRIN